MHVIYLYHNQKNYFAWPSAVRCHTFYIYSQGDIVHVYVMKVYKAE
jgi:hypothetical protein